MTSTTVRRTRYTVGAACVVAAMLLGLVIGAMPVLAQDEEDPAPEGGGFRS